MSILVLFYFLNFFQVFAHNRQPYTHRHCEQDSHEDWICNYMRIHNKTYSSSAEMKLRRTRLLTRQHHGDQPSVRFGLTSRSDRFQHELKRNLPLQMEHHKRISRQPSLKRQHSRGRLPPIDWRNHNGISFVTPVLDQGECGDCFAFAAATVLEYWSKKHGHPKALSAQNIMDCTSGPMRPDVGCDGGLMEYVFEYAKQHPITLRTDFPYKEEQRHCPARRLMSHVKVNKFEVIMHDENPRTEKEFESILHKYGPISVGIDSTTMDDYSGGVFPASLCTTEIDHAVAIVGYTKDAWIIKNSWGPSWGRDGYLYLERGSNACGVAEYGVYVTDASPSHELLTTDWEMEAY